jgi:hypothetical protein
VLVLAAGAGTRLLPLTHVLPKPLCPVLDRSLLDHTVERVEGLDPARLLDVVVNVHHGGAAVVDHLDRRGVLAGQVDPDGGVRPVDAAALGHLVSRLGAPVGDEPGPGAPGPTPGTDRRPVLVSPERDRALGTAGAVGRLVPWLDGRGVLVLNADTATDVALAPLVAGWDGRRPRVLVVGEDVLGPTSRVAGALLPWEVARGLAAEPSGLWERAWRDAVADGTMEVVTGRGTFVDCGTPGAYLRANLAALDRACTRDPATGRAGATDPGVALRCAAAGGWWGAGAEVTGTVRRSVVGAGAVVAGEVVDSVLWPGARVAPGESLHGAIRTAPAPRTGRAVTVLAR